MPRVDRPSPGGFTLLELIIAVALAAALFAALYGALHEARDPAGAALERSGAENEANDLLQRVADTLREASPSSPDWALSETGDSITFNRCLGYADGALDWDAALTLAAVPLEGPLEAEGSDGLDNDGNLLVDEMALVYGPAGSPGEAWSRRIARGGFLVEAQGGNLAVTLVLQLTPERAGIPPATVSAVTLVSPRN